MTELQESILELRAQGLSYNKILQELNCARSTVAHHCNSTSRFKARKLRTDWRKSFRILLKLEAGGECEVCKYSRCLSALHFHHRDPSLKLFSISDSIRDEKRPAILEEVKKCTLLCANCHAEIHEGIISLPKSKSKIKR